MITRTEKLLKVLADEKRLRILKLLQKHPCCVCELAAVLGVTQPSISRHLNKLCSVGLLSSKKMGFWTDYFLNIQEFSKKSSQKKVVLLILKEMEKDERIKKDKMILSKSDRSKLCSCRNKV
jgi:ArsR family transcriptional regulator